MGVIICEQHGRQHILFVNDELLRCIQTKIKTQRIYRMEVSHDEYLNNIFFIDEASYENIDRTNFIAELKLILEDVKPLCVNCFSQYIENKSIVIDDKKIIS